jgi:hypothetical protein
MPYNVLGVVAQEHLVDGRFHYSIKIRTMESLDREHDTDIHD